MATDRFDVQHQVSFRELVRRRYRRGILRVRDYNAVAPETNSRFLFVVGCGHSGTTLTAAKLGNHSAVKLIGNETYLFCPWRSLDAASCTLGEWDRDATNSGLQWIVEKTPKHVQVHKRVKFLVPQARFLVVLRNPLDTIASLNIRFGSLEYSLQRWLLDAAASRRLIQQGARPIRYENLTQDPVREFRELCEWMGLGFEPEMLEAGITAYDNAHSTGNMLLRREQVRAPISPQLGKWRESLSTDEINYVVKRTVRLAAKLGYDMRDLACS